MLAEIDWDSGMTEAFTDVVSFIPKLAAFLVILVVGVFVAKIIRGSVGKILTKIKVDAFVERSGIPKMLGDQSLSGARLGASAIYAIVMFVVIKIALSAFGTNPISDLLDSFIAFLPKVIVALVLVVVTGWVADKVRDVVSTATHGRREQSLAVTVASTSVWVIGGFAALDQIEVAGDIVKILFQTLIGSLGLIMVIKFGVGGIWAARDRFWPAVYDKVSGPQSTASRPETEKQS